MTIKILHAADIHIDLYKPKVPHDWQLNRFRLFFEKMLELEKSHDLTVLAGDIFDAKPEPDEINLFDSYLEKVTKPTLVIPGNHEASKKGETFLEGYVLHKPIHNSLVQFYTKNARIRFMDYWIQMFPYTEVQTNNLENHAEKDILITHIRGEVPPHITAEYDFEKLKEFKLVLCGDLHFNHKYKDYNVYYPGSPLNINFDRREDKEYGVYSHTFWKEGHTYQFIDLKLPKLIRKRIKAGENLTEDSINRVIYEVTGKLEDIQKIEKSDLLDKKLIDLPQSFSTLNLKNKSLPEEVSTYLTYLKVENIPDYLTELNNLNVSFAEAVTKTSSSIVLKTMNWSNMFSYGEDNTIDFNKEVITQLEAINGTGKTSLVFILQELLTSKNIKGIKKGNIINRYSGIKKWSADIEFTVNNIPYSLSVTRTGESSKVKLLKDGIDISQHKIPDTYKLLLGLFNTTPEVLSQLIYQSSDCKLEFLKATDTNRKKFLVNLFSLENYLQIGETIKAKIIKVEQSLASVEGELKTVQDFLAGQYNLGEKQTTKLVPDIDETLKEEIKQLEYEVSNHSKLCLQIDRNNLLIKERGDITFSNDLQDIDTHELETTKNEIADLSSQIAHFNKDLAGKQKELTNLNTATHCPTCKQAIDNSQSIAMAEEIKAYINGTKLLIGDREEELNNNLIPTRQKLMQQHLNFQSNLKKIERFEQLSSLIDHELSTEYPNITTLKTQLTTKKLELENQVKSNTDTIKYNNEINILNAKIDLITQQKREFLTGQVLLNDDKINIQNQLNRLNILKKAFSPTGIVAFKLENIIKEFEQEINDYLVEFSDGSLQISFKLEGEKLNIIIFSDGEESPIENTSEGEFSRIQTSTLLAIRKLLSKMHGVQINLLFMDEIFGVLDEIGQNKLIEILLKEENTNTFLIAHGYDNPLVPKIRIVKTNNIARIT